MKISRLVSLRFSSLLLAVLVAPLARADVLVNYAFTGGSLSATAFDSVNFASASDVSRGSAFNTPASFSTDWVYVGGDRTPNSAPSSEAASYFTFTLTPQEGVSYNLTSLTFDVAFYESAGKANGYTTNYVVRSDLTGYDTDLLSASEMGQTTTTPTFHGLTVDLSGASFQSVSGAVTFRIYVWDGINGDTRLSAIDNLTLNGSPAMLVPEPSTAALLAGFTTLGLVMTRRRCRHVAAGGHA